MDKDKQATSYEEETRARVEKVEHDMQMFAVKFCIAFGDRYTRNKILRWLDQDNADSD